MTVVPSQWSQDGPGGFPEEVRVALASIVAGGLTGPTGATGSAGSGGTGATGPTGAAGWSTSYLTANFTGSTGTSGQAIFPSGQDEFTAGTNKTYAFEGLIALSKAAGANNHNLSFLFGGTAVIASVQYRLKSRPRDSNNLDLVLADSSGFAIAATAFAFDTSITSAGHTNLVEVRGTMVITTGGTVIPQYSVSANPGGFYMVNTGSRFSFQEIGSNAFTADTSWS